MYKGISSHVYGHVHDGSGSEGMPGQHTISHLNRQSPEQNVVCASEGEWELVGVTIQPCAVCHDWFLVWSSAAQKECLNGVGVHFLQFSQHSESRAEGEPL